MVHIPDTSGGIAGPGTPGGDPSLALLLVKRELSGPITAALGGDPPGSIVALEFPGASANATTKLLIRDGRGAPRLVLLVSSPLGPDIVARGVEAAASAREALGNELGDVILTPTLVGRLDGLSYALLPYCQPLSNRPLLRELHTWQIRPLVLEWLRAVISRTATPVPSQDLESKIAAPLRHLSSLEDLGEDIRGESRKGLERLQSGAWHPRYALMHGDLTRGNVLKPPRALLASGSAIPARKFVLIDWPGGQLRGYPFLDLIAFGRSMRLGSGHLREEVGFYCDVLGCAPEEARYALLAALGDIALHLDRFPFDQFVLLARAYFGCLESVFTA